MKKKYKKIILLFLILGMAIITGCGSKGNVYDFNKESINAPSYPDISFAVISDIHVYDKSLGSSGSAFEKVMFSDRKLLLDSFDLLDFAINEITASDAEFVLITGDLTKDGELINHTIAAEKLKKLTDKGINVFVIPGNHDVNSPDSFKYSGDTAEPVPNVSEEDFASIYAHCGFNAAIKRDVHSLSYLAQPAEGLWLLAIDSARHRENKAGDHAIVSGKINQGTADWIADVLREASKQKIAVIAMMHHGFAEHWNGQKKLHPDYIVQDFENFGKFLASWNVRAGFTGHYHAHDITRADFNGKYLYDIETGSLVTAPCPIRYVNIKDNVMNIKTDFIIDRIHPDTDFAANATAFVKKTVMLEAANVLKKFNVSQRNIDIITDAVGDAFTAHYSGDENPSLRKVLDKSKLSAWGKFILSQQQYVLDGLWLDLPPSDINVSLQLN